jgi:AcrR family transcriptional regulator
LPFASRLLVPIFKAQTTKEALVVQPKTRNKIVDSLMALAAERRWDEVTLEALAERSGVTLAGLRAAYDGRLSVLADFVRRIDERVLASLDSDLADEAPRERLFDILFSRFEALGPHRQAIRNLGEAARRDPLLALELNRIVTGSMTWMLTAASIPATGAMGLARAQGLALVWAQVMRVWLDDDDPGLARTMAALDTQLRRAERRVRRLNRIARFVRGARRPRREAPIAPTEARDIAEGHPS